ncbi:TVP38/TMEM64 family protein [Globicatella sanguinis]|uniref:TVP38/TMEM64 family protein n=1 Tax=Globicatella sanguinis TaxID=13076 RepID=UPI00082520FF|nr:VTT domain-containing protein [Globicatella sanguinis]MDK7629846.1 VTT domain-containing protein [Globicatella sanguinis]WIK65747.1 VTT domain-containing protein [Globicatella sanguinis]WKT55152.1 VTT domain-containing protein [Globicatella sanguinis]
MSLISLKKKRSLIRYTTIVGIIFTVIASFFIAQSSFFKPGGGFNELLEKLGIIGPIVFIFLQITQTIYPIIPMGLTNVIGNLVFGTWLGFLCNVTGMLIGSCINFYLGRRFGESVVKAFISDEQYEKYISKIGDSKAFERLIIIGFILPVFPDDIFCMISGMSKLTFKRFFILVLLCRPISLFVFTYAWAEIIRFASTLWG